MGSCHVSKTATTWPILRKFSWKIFSKLSLPATLWSTMIRNWLLTKKPGHDRLSSQVGTKWKLETKTSPQKIPTKHWACEFLQFRNKCRRKHRDVSAHSTSLRHSALVMPWHAVREVSGGIKAHGKRKKRGKETAGTYDKTYLVSKSKIRSLDAINSTETKSIPNFTKTYQNRMYIRKNPT